MNGWSERADGLHEIMDDPGCDPARLANTYGQFGAINTLVSGWHGLYRSHLRPALQAAGSSSSLLDIGCGGGDLLRRIARWTRRDGLRVRLVGADPDDRAVAYARSVPRSPANVTYRSSTARLLRDSGERFDVVISNHVLHHLPESGVTALCEDSMRLASRLALHSDVRRSRLAYATFPLLAIWFRHSFIRQDGRISIRRSFTPPELARLAPTGWEARGAFPFRSLLIWEAERPPQPPNNGGSSGATEPDTESNPTPPIIGGLGGL